MVFINKEIFPDFFIGDSDIIVQAIVNISPESFYKGSFVKEDEIKNTIQNFINNGAQILDIGARSTAPWSAPITREEELGRLKTYLSTIVELIPKNIIISIDTQYSEIAEYCINYCDKNDIKCMINDVAGLKIDEKLKDIIIDYDVPLILMATHQKPGDIITVNSILKSLFESIMDLENSKYNLNKLIIDPGIGKWIAEKTYEYDLSIIDNLERFRVFGNPILVGISRKSFIGTVLGGKSPEERYNGTLAATSIAVYNGAHIVRTHDVNPELMEMLEVSKSIRKKPLIISENGITGGLIGFIKDPIEARFYLRRMGVTPAGSRIMDQKMVTKLILLKNLTAPQAMILKQELLARGGDVAIHRDVVTTEFAKHDMIHDAVLIGTEKQMQSLITKLKGQQLDLDKVSTVISNIIQKSKEDKFLHSI
ncbi:MAG: dihydropteroate synthase [archaeon]|nr:dihydropteroate synthase [archaeon]